MKKLHSTQKGNAKRIAFLILPYLCVLAAAVLLSVSAYVYLTTSSVVQLAINDMKGGSDSQTVDFESTLIEAGDAEEFPVIGFQTQWATVNVEGWRNKNIPVYLGDTVEVLRWGAGMPMYAQYCGFGGRVVMSAHVTTFFREIEDTAVGTKVSVATVYGKYIYRVDKIQVFDPNDSTYIRPNTDREELVMYTCYPYDNHYRPRTQRIALICSKVEGKEWRTAP